MKAGSGGRAASPAGHGGRPTDVPLGARSIPRPQARRNLTDGITISGNRAARRGEHRADADNATFIGRATWLTINVAPHPLLPQFRLRNLREARRERLPGQRTSARAALYHEAGKLPRMPKCSSRSAPKLEATLRSMSVRPGPSRADAPGREQTGTRSRIYQTRQ